MRRLTALLTALVMPTSHPLLLSSVTSTAVVILQVPAQALSEEGVAQVAKAITVRIEGASQGSGVLVKREGNLYKVLTAWHVVRGQQAGEELDVYTPDGQRHSVEQGSIQRVGEVDMALLSFVSSGSYELASVGDVKTVSSGSNIYVSGFPLPTSAVPSRIFRFKKGSLEANAQVFIPNGYQLLYSNPTLPGMSGGAVLNSQAELIGIHGQGETDSQMSELQGIAVKTGTNQAVPITHYKQSALANYQNTINPMSAERNKIPLRTRLIMDEKYRKDIEARHRKEAEILHQKLNGHRCSVGMWGRPDPYCL